MAKRTSKKAVATASAISVEAPISTIESATDDSVEIGTVITESGFATNEEVLGIMCLIVRLLQSKVKLPPFPILL